MDDAIPSELRAVLKLSLSSRDNIVAAAAEGGERRIPVLRELIQAILFSRRFTPSYILVMVTTILLWGSVKWLITCVRSRKKKKRLQEERPAAASIASSSSSTLQGTESPPSKDDNVSEATPLLAEAQLRVRRPRSAPVRTWHRIRSLMLRQPKPIPSVTAPKNTLPANETSMVILLFLALNLFYLFYRMPLSRAMVFAFADRAGIAFVVNLPVLYTFAAKNNQPLQYITGWSYEGLNIFHRRLGEWMTVAAILHAIGMVVAFYDLIAPSGYTLGWYLTRKIILLGTIAFCFYLGIYFTSIGYFRQAFYELFLALHIFLQVGALVMLFFHHHTARPYVGAALAIWALDRLVSRMLCKTGSFIATLQIAADKETVLLYCDVPLRKRNSFGMKGGWHAGQHVFLTVPEMGTKHKLQAHPFTIASPAPKRGTSDETWPLQLTIRAQDGFSRDLLEYAKLHQHTRVYMDGPYSSNEVLEAVRNCDRLCLIAGGSGIAVTYPFAWDREVESNTAKDIVYDRVFYANGVKVRPTIKKSFPLLDESRFAHFWIRQDTSHEAWLTMLPSTEQPSYDVSSEGVTANTGNTLDLVTHRFDTRSATGEHRRPDIKAELEAWLRGDIKQKIDMQHNICVVVSGPDALVRDVQNTVASLVREGWNVDIHVEKFGW
ncbi:hypothetical protein LTR70_007486 [Exophiala xenobiotica]|uniref:FAD-binding FR-type domain-containing protein n=1 Tax=Lithohypha guttulata TaxID=1690604 RepID=A0ABR0KNQ4_9EURO|nr:hypothetical protein LTR24_000407 [Lithohypha guttulata]KAK5313716.1 hypothetical protein LTR70_007486 [Exophiala xenobiotica]